MHRPGFAAEKQAITCQQRDDRREFRLGRDDHRRAQDDSGKDQIGTNRSHQSFSLANPCFNAYMAAWVRSSRCSLLKILLT